MDKIVQEKSFKTGIKNQGKTYDDMNKILSKLTEMQGNINELQDSVKDCENDFKRLDKYIIDIRKDIAKLNPIAVANINSKLDSLEHDVKLANDGIIKLTGRINYIQNNEKLI